MAVDDADLSAKMPWKKFIGKGVEDLDGPVFCGKRILCQMAFGIIIASTMISSATPAQLFPNASLIGVDLPRLSPG